MKIIKTILFLLIFFTDYIFSSEIINGRIGFNFKIINYNDLSIDDKISFEKIMMVSEKLGAIERDLFVETIIYMVDGVFIVYCPLDCFRDWCNLVSGFKVPGECVKLKYKKRSLTLRLNKSFKLLSYYYYLYNSKPDMVGNLNTKYQHAIKSFLDYFDFC